MRHALFVLFVSARAAAELATFHVLDESGTPTPARLEVLDALGVPYVPDLALPIDLACPSEPVPNDAPGCATGFKVSNYLDNPITGTRQFYSDGTFTLELPPGRYTLGATKGLEHLAVKQAFEVAKKTGAQVTVTLKRWSNLPSRGWFSADDHLHIQRLSPTDDAELTTLAQAEDLNVANLIQIGNEQAFVNAVQYAFGDTGAWLTGDTLLLSGQEHPRTHLFGHTLILGASEPIDVRETYSVYDTFFALAGALGGVSGYAHWGLGAGQLGLALDAPKRRISFIEVLQFEYPHYEVWYQTLNLGFPLAPTAGTDFPCGPYSVPGRERFYVRVNGKLSRASWLEGLKAGRTFVTNGPLIDFHVGDAELGDQLTLAAAGTVAIHATITFDPARDTVKRVTLIRNGEPTELKPTTVAPGVLSVDTMVRVAESSWFALRVSGDKLGETPLTSQGYSNVATSLASTYSAGVSMTERETFAGTAGVRPSEAHTAAIWVTLSSGPAVERQPRSHVIAREWLERLDVLEAKLKDENIGTLQLPLWALPNSDAVNVTTLLKNRERLRELILESRAYFKALGPGPAPVLQKR
ncbi:MAG: CehA/McbA family metallohydrolase [Myxococcaceae bacterium]|nr:CehA/McbA family metallohydrolase [Myxococcaceae bacterium]